MVPEIRDAIAADAPSLLKAELFYAQTPGHLVSHPEEVRAKSFENMISSLTHSENGKYIVAIMDEKIVGHAMLEQLPLIAIKHVVRLTLVVHPGWQSKGIGKRMLAYLINWARENPKIEKIELNVRHTNTKAMDLYTKMGFTEEGRLQRRIKTADGYLNDVVMALFVDKAAE